MCLTLCDPMDCSPPGCSVHGISQTRILQWVAVSSPGAYPVPSVSCTDRQVICRYRHLGSPRDPLQTHKLLYQNEIILLCPFKFLLKRYWEFTNAYFSHSLMERYTYFRKLSCLCFSDTSVNSSFLKSLQGFEYALPWECGYVAGILILQFL